MNKFKLKELQILCKENGIETKIPTKNNKSMKNMTKKQLMEKLNDKMNNVIKIEEITDNTLTNKVKEINIQIPDIVKIEEITDIVTDNTLTNKVEEMKIDDGGPLNPLFKWSGGKKDEIKFFKHHLPKEYDTYLEPFFGGGALLCHLRPKKAAFSDVHTELIDFYQNIKDKKMDEMYKYMEGHPNDEKSYYKVRSLDRQTEKLTPLQNACRFYYIRKTCYRGMSRYNSKGHFNIPFGRYKTYNFANLKDKRYEDLFQNVIIHKGDFNYIFENFDNENNFMFLDPPYDTPFSDYGYCIFGKEEHKRLAKLFKKSKCKCLMIISATDFIRELYDGYIVEEFSKKYRFRIHSNRINKDNIDKMHLIIKNY